MIIVDLEAGSSEPTDFPDYITGKFSDMAEDDLNLAEIYKKRENADERQIVYRKHLVWKQKKRIALLIFWIQRIATHGRNP